MDLLSSIKVSESGMKSQSSRLLIVSQNIANKGSTALSPGGDPYRRKTIYFHNKFDPKSGVELVEVARYGNDHSQFKMKLQPYHPAANKKGYVLYPNVDDVIENTDIQEAQLSYNANLNALALTKSMIIRTLDILNKQ